MALTINKKISLTNFNTGSASRIKYLVIHYVGATGGAEDNCDYFYSTYRGASAHYFVGHNGEIWQCVLDKNIAWHCGTKGTYYHTSCRNSNALGIEMCCRKDSKGNWYFEEATVKSTIALAKELMAKYNIPIENVLRHYDVTHKCCPAPYVNDGAAWTKFKAQLTATPSVGTYKVVTEINKYSTADDAKNQKNALKTKLAAGTYYIFSKYPNGYNGMYNVTKDDTGSEPGSWINPKENVAPTTTTTTTKELYRVRQAWSNAKTQKGAFSNLQNAKNCADDNAAEGYKVYDSAGKLVYTGVVKKPETPVTETPKVEKPVETPKVETPVVEVPVTAVYDLKYPEFNTIVTGDSNCEIDMQYDCCAAIKLILQNNPNFDVNIAKAFYDIARVYGINPDWAIAQSILETGWFKFEGSSVKPEQHNYCGLGATGGGVSGATFDTIEKGVHAQLQHLFAYGSKDNVPSGVEIVDPRFKYVTRGIAPNWEQLAGRWAVPGYDKNTYSTPEAAMNAGNTYGQKIAKIVAKIEAITVTFEDVDKYFPAITEPTPDVKDEPNVPDTPTTPDVPEKNTNDVQINEGLVNKIVKAIIEFLKALFVK